MMAREYFSKVMAIWWLTFAFVYLGLDHVVANMFFVPTANFHGDPAISTTFYIWKSLIPALVGNIVSGALFVGVFFWYLVSSLQHDQVLPRLTQYNSGSLAKDPWRLTACTFQLTGRSWVLTLAHLTAMIVSWKGRAVERHLRRWCERAHEGEDTFCVLNADRSEYRVQATCVAFGTSKTLLP